MISKKLYFNIPGYVDSEVYDNINFNKSKSIYGSYFDSLIFEMGSDEFSSFVKELKKPLFGFIVEKANYQTVEPSTDEFVVIPTTSFNTCKKILVENKTVEHFHINGCKINKITLFSSKQSNNNIIKMDVLSGVYIRTKDIATSVDISETIRKSKFNVYTDIIYKKYSKSGLIDTQSKKICNFIGV